MNPAIRQLIEKGQRSLRAAEALFERGDHDFAVSRAYYAMFYLAEAALLARGLSFSKHSAVISAFGRELVKAGHLPANLHDALRSAFDARSIGDYGAASDYPHEPAQRTLQQARDFVEAVGALLQREAGPLRLGVLLSGGGRTLQNLIDVIARGGLNAEIAIVISSLSKVKGFERAKNAGLPLVVIRKKDHPDVDEFSRRIVETLDAHDVQLAVQAGWMCLWRLPERWLGRVMNIHPGLLPEFGGRGFYGHHVHEAVLAAGETESGCTVHFADNEYDAGPIILQRKVRVLPDDTPDALADRVFEQECIAYPEAIRLFAENRLVVRSNRVEVLPSAR